MAETPIILNALQLRRLADAASSDRGGDPHWLVYHYDKEAGEKLTVCESATPPAGAVFGVETKVVEDRPRPRAVIIDCDGATRDLAEAYDAVFWSEAAVEKFVLPYYASKSLWEAASVLDKLSRYWYGEIPPDTETGDLVDVPLTQVPYAIAHTPDSDWNTLSIDTIGSDLHLLVREGEVVRAHRLSDLPDFPPCDGTADPAPQTPAAAAGA